MVFFFFNMTILRISGQCFSYKICVKECFCFVFLFFFCFFLFCFVVVVVVVEILHIRLRY